MDKFSRVVLDPKAVYQDKINTLFSVRTQDKDKGARLLVEIPRNARTDMGSMHYLSLLFCSKQKHMQICACNFWLDDLVEHMIRGSHCIDWYNSFRWMAYVCTHGTVKHQSSSL